MSSTQPTNRAIHYVNDAAGNLTAACRRRMGRLTLHTMIADQVTCESCRNVMENRPF